MQFLAALLVSFLAIGLPALCFSMQMQVQDSPLPKVLELLQELQSKVQAHGDAEEKTYRKYFDWCELTSTNLKHQIKTTKIKKQKLEAKIAELSSSIEASDATIGKLAAAIAKSDAELGDTEAIRKKDTATFVAEESELLEIIDHLGRAIPVLQREMEKNPASFAQLVGSGENGGIAGMLQSLSTVVDAASFPNIDKQKLLELVQARKAAETDDDELGEPGAAAYNFHSTDIIDLLVDMKDKAEDQLSGLRKAETKSRHNYEMLKQSLDDQTKVDTTDMEAEKKDKNAAAESKATAEGDLSMTDKDFATSNAEHDTTNNNCMQNAADHEQSIASRDEELKTIGKAQKIILEETKPVAGQAFSMLQLKSSSRIKKRGGAHTLQVDAMVLALAKKHHSVALEQLASRIRVVLRYGSSNGDDPFAKVKELIKEMLKKLEIEAIAEGTEKAYCDEEMSKSEAKKGELENDVSKLMTEIDQAASKAADLQRDVKRLMAELVDIAADQRDIYKIRLESNNDYVQVKKDLEQGLSGIRKAIQVLQMYYANEGAAAMLQDDTQFSAFIAEGDIMDAHFSHNKATGAGASIIGLLQVLESDFATSLAKEESSEADSASQYERATQESKIAKVEKEQDVKYKTQEIRSLEKRFTWLTEEKESMNSELSAVLEYHEKLKHRCIAQPESYEERKNRRIAEIEGLKEAITVLQSQASFMQRRGHGRRHLRGKRKSELAAR